MQSKTKKIPSSKYKSKQKQLYNYISKPYTTIIISLTNKKIQQKKSLKYIYNFHQNYKKNISINIFSTKKYQ